MWIVAVRQSGVPQVMPSQSTKPVTAVAPVTISPTISASHQAVAMLASETPTALRTANAAAAV
jgi:hypothetical protein